MWKRRLHLIECLCSMLDFNIHFKPFGKTYISMKYKSFIISIPDVNKHHFDPAMAASYGMNGDADAVNKLFEKLTKIKTTYVTCGPYRVKWMPFENEDELELQLALAGFLKKK